MWGREGLVQIEVHYINAQVTGTGNAEQCVEVGAIAIDKPTAGVYQLDDLQHVLIKQTKRIWVGQHQACDRIIAKSLQYCQIHIATRI
ncbi:hypothetical protein SDC9_132742 [bioreactor metagenome]|uniref:Uncharacterized protein n=1 Tax=bioreactor metagenome TaxID=1076179 RepID=A0A645D8R9_9ZZZZ